MAKKNQFRNSICVKAITILVLITFFSSNVYSLTKLAKNKQKLDEHLKEIKDSTLLHFYKAVDNFFTKIAESTQNEENLELFKGFSFVDGAGRIFMYYKAKIIIEQDDPFDEFREKMSNFHLNIEGDFNLSIFPTKVDFKSSKLKIINFDLNLVINTREILLNIIKSAVAGGILTGFDVIVKNIANDLSNIPFGTVKSGVFSTLNQTLTNILQSFANKYSQDPSRRDIFVKNLIKDLTLVGILKALINNLTGTIQNEIITSLNAMLKSLVAGSVLSAISGNVFGFIASVLLYQISTAVITYLTFNLPTNITLTKIKNLRKGDNPPNLLKIELELLERVETELLSENYIYYSILCNFSEKNKTSKPFLTPLFEASEDLLFKKVMGIVRNNFYETYRLCEENHRCYMDDWFAAKKLYEYKKCISN